MLQSALDSAFLAVATYALTGGQVTGPDDGEIVILLTVEDFDALRMNDAIATSMKKKPSSSSMKP